MKFTQLKKIKFFLVKPIKKENTNIVISITFILFIFKYLSIKGKEIKEKLRIKFFSTSFFRLAYDVSGFYQKLMDSFSLKFSL